MPIAGQVIAKRYRLERPLGSGGMGSVWVATHLELDAKVALKFQHVSGVRASDERFRREARAAARLRSPRVVHIHDYGIDGELPFIAMELLTGESLRERLARERRLQPAAVCEIVQQAADALDLAHAAGIVHRDMKPSNLFLSREGRMELVKLLDFGIAKWADADQSGTETESALMVGSAAYMSPEQARGERVDAGSDVWSLGVVTYEMLLGECPFRGPNVPETLTRVAAGVHQPPSRKLGPVPELDRFFERCFELEPARRFASAGALAAELTRVLRDVPASAFASLTPATSDVEGRVNDTATMGASISRSGTHRERRHPSTRAVLVVGSGAAVAVVIAALIASRPPSPQNLAERVPSVGSRSQAATAAPGRPAFTGTELTPAREQAAAAASVAGTNAAPPASAPKPRSAIRFTGSAPSSSPPASRVPAASSGPAVRPEPPPGSRVAPAASRDPVFGLELPSP